MEHTSRGRRSTLTGLIGQGVGPSLTPELHEREALRQHVRYVYKVIELGDAPVTPEYLRRLLDAAVELGYDGLNVTHPVKQTMVPLVDRVTADVQAIGALNTVLVVGGTTVGHNTDVTGFGRAFRDGLPDARLDAVVLLGAGGAGTAVAHALARRDLGRLLVVDRRADRARDLADSMRSHGIDIAVVPEAGLPEALSDASGVINATPVGMAAHPGSPLPPPLLRPELWVADIVYRPLVTELLSTAADQGCKTLSGAGMAVHQAADAFELITGLRADRDSMFRDFDDIVSVEVATTSADTHRPRDNFGERNP